MKQLNLWECNGCGMQWDEVLERNQCPRCFPSVPGEASTPEASEWQRVESLISEARFEIQASTSVLATMRRELVEKADRMYDSLPYLESEEEFEPNNRPAWERLQNLRNQLADLGELVSEIEEEVNEFGFGRAKHLDRPKH